MYQTDANRVLIATWPFVVVVLLVTLFVKDAVDGSAVAKLILLVAGALVSAAVMWRVLGTGLIVTDTGVTVAGVIRRRTFGWGDVKGYTQKSAAPYNASVYIGVELNDGRVVTTVGLVAIRDSAFVVGTLADLERELYRRTPPPDPAQLLNNPE